MTMADDEEIETGEEADAEEVDTSAVEPDDDDVLDDVVALDDGDDDDEEEEDDDDDDDDSAARVRKRKGDEEEEDENEMLAPDDVEADLDTILKDRMVTTTEDDEDDEPKVAIKAADRTDVPDGIQPKRADEILCTSCFLLVRPTAPGCPVEDDACPIFG